MPKRNRSTTNHPPRRRHRLLQATHPLTFLPEPLESRLLLSRVIYVSPADNNGPAANDGSSWPAAYVGLQPALAAATPGDTIHVAQGTYKPTDTTDRTLSFVLKNGVALYGGYAGYGTTNPDARDIALYPTILSGDLGTTADNSDNSYHVLVGSNTDATAILDGFTITAGNANAYYPDGTGPLNRGGGMYNSAGRPTIRNCAFRGNSASDSGGGIYNISSSPALINCTFGNSASWGAGMYNSSSAPVLTDCTFIANSASGSGGGMCNYASSPMLTNCTLNSNWAADGGGMANHASSSPVLTNCVFTGNEAWYYTSGGGGMVNHSSSPVLINCTFSDNLADYDGGGMGNWSSSSPTLTNCTFTRNSAVLGAGLFNESSSPVLTNCTFIGNAASTYPGHGGGGMMNRSLSSPVLTNCAFIGNSGYYGGGMSNERSLVLTNCSFIGNAASYGGGIDNSTYYYAPVLTNCTFVGNSASIRGGAIDNGSSSLGLTNCIVWDNTAPSGSQIYNDRYSLNVVTYSDIQGGYTGTGNINADPQFLRNPSPGPDGKVATADDDYGDLRLFPLSPAVDAGNNAAVPAAITTDLAGNPRFTDLPIKLDTGTGTPPLVDMGAYETPLAPSLTLGPSQLFTLPAGQSLLLQAASLSMTGGTLDLTTNALLITNNAPATLALITSYVQSGMANNWTGPGLISSNARTATRKTLAVVDNAIAHLPTLNGQTIASNAIIVAYTLKGDATLDHSIDISDYSAIDNGFLAHNTLSGWSNGDFNYDATIDIADYSMIDDAFLNQAAALAPAATPTPPLAPLAAALPPTDPSAAPAPSLDLADLQSL